ncbi:MAG: acetyl-CoA carboxylase biotin carboxyl carrier protein [Candidatus Binatia bacterium]
MRNSGGPAEHIQEGNKITKLIQDDILQIMKLFENSSFDYLQLEFGDLKLTVSKAGYNPGSPPAEVETGVRAQKAEVLGMPQTAAKAAAQQAAKPKVAQTSGDSVTIPAPMVGTFYTAPSPGAPPFVALGDSVNEDTTVGLIEVMKVFNAVTAGVSGSISEICVENGQFVEYGQSLFLVTPDGTQKAKDSAG